MKKNMKFIDLFAGIGGFHLAFHSLGAECVFASEIDQHARKTYQHNFESISKNLFKDGMFNDDILKVLTPEKEIPDFDVLCAGFPCQPFSQAGYKRGFGENLQSRGNMFFQICRIIEAKRPKAFFLENVRHLIKHDNERTFKIIEKSLTDLGYSFYWKVVKACEYGLPQIRPRVFMVGYDQSQLLDVNKEFNFPKPIPLTLTMSDIWGGECDRTIGYTLRVGGRGSGLHDRRNWDSYLVDGREKRLSYVEGSRMMGFPEDFEFPVTNAQALKQLGNSVAVNAVKATAEQMIVYMNENLKNCGSSKNRAA